MTRAGEALELARQTGSTSAISMARLATEPRAPPHQATP